MNNNHPRLKIAILSAYSLRTPGGVQNQMIEQARALQAAGQDVTIIASGLDRSAYPLPVQGLDCGWSIGLPGNGSVAYIAFSPRGFFRILRTLKQFDIVHVHEPFYPFTLALIHFSRATFVATFHAQHEPNWLYLLGKPFFRITRAWRRLRLRLAVSDRARQTVLRYFKGEVSIVPNGIDLNHPLPRENRPASGRKTVLFLGRNEARKGLPRLLEAYTLIRKEHPEIELLVAGAGTERIRGEGIRGLGLVDNQTRDRLLCEADCLCVPSSGQESFGIILLEGMRAGIPVVAADIPGYRTTLVHGRNALLFEPDNPRAMADALLEILQDRRLSARLVRNGRKTCRAYGWEEIALRLLHHYRNTLKKEPVQSSGRDQ